jgi:prepilin-type N-terminal cleavage/methylation domain-containing protein
MKQAFTLIEVIIAAILISLMSIGILQLQSNTTHNLSILSQQKKMDQLASPILSQPDKKLHNKQQELYTFIKDRYIIDYAPLIDALKKHKVHFLQKELSSIKIDLAKSQAEQKGSLDSSVPKLQLLIKSNELKTSVSSAKSINFEVLQ